MIFLQLSRNYARFRVGGFQPISFQEILFALKDTPSREITNVRNVTTETGISSDNTYMHQEFPFSFLAGYPRIDIDEETDADAGSGKLLRLVVFLLLPSFFNSITPLMGCDCSFVLLPTFK